MPATDQKVTVDRNGHRLHVGDWVYYGGSVIRARSIMEIVAIYGDGRMDLKHCTGGNLGGVRRASVRFEHCDH